MQNTPSEFDIIIAGAGPGGCAAALTLRDQGLRILILDKATFPRDKICGDALSGKVRSVLRYIAPDLEQSLLDMPAKLGSWGIRFVAPNGGELDVPFKHTPDLSQPAPGFISKRLDFDQFLVDQVKNIPGVELKENCSLRSVQQERDHIRVESSQGKFTASLLIAADGAQSVAARQLVNRKVLPKHHSAGVRAYVSQVSGFHTQNFIELHFLPELLPGYFWIFPLPNGQANVGLGMLTADLKQQKLDLKKALRETIFNHPRFKDRFVSSEILGPIQGFGLPLGSQRSPLSGERFMLVGDAGALIDPFSGEGIGNAMLSGKKAAEVAMEALREQDFSATFLERYDQIVYQKIGQELALSYRLQRLVQYPWLFNWVVKKARGNPSFETLFTMM